MNQPFRPDFLPMTVGSLPYDSPAVALEQILQNTPDIPAWPQLPKRTFLENMYVQYSQGFPGIVVDMQNERIYVDRERDLDPELEQLYTSYLENDLRAGALSEEYAAGLSYFLKQHFDSARAVKGHVTGPVSWGLTVTDQNRRPILYDEVLAEAVAKHLRLNASWQERQLRHKAVNTIMFVDEPYMSSFGSAYVAIEREQVIALLEEVFEGIHGLKGVHCCGNTDWSILLSTSVDILNLDAYEYAETLSLYPEALDAFLDRGGIVAWGIVPTLDEAALMGEEVGSLSARLEAAIQLMASKGVSLDKLLASALVTPSCGLRTLSEAGAERALSLLAEVSRRMRERYGYR
jgi:methionine synthase II (cobalamin-independent)